MKSLIRHLYLLITLALSVATPLTVFAFAADHWAPASLLNEGKWVKISVQSTGLHLISSSDLRSWGFNDPAKVRIYGYGGQRISDHLKPEFYVDDLPAVPSAVTSRGVVFYAVGIETPLKTEDGRWTYHSLNPYSTAAYYFLTESDEAAPAITKFGGAPVGTPENSFIESVRHETDLTTPAESGHLLLGEDFRFSTSNTFPFNLTDRVEGTDVWMQCDFFARTLSQPLRLAFKANDAALPSLPADRVRNTSDYGDSCRIRKIFPMQGTRLNLNVSAALSGTVTVASLDNISICYTRALRLPATGYLMFSVNIPDVALGGVSSSDALHVWDVTDPHAVKELNLSPSGDGMGWHNEYYGERAYAAWKEKASLPSPKYAGAVSNQNIHGRNVPSMVIISHPDLINASERVAEIHRQLTDSLDILVVSDVEVYNEFSSGVPDVNAFRKMLKMFYDREPGKLAYVMLMGSVTHDHRFLTAGMSGSRNATLPIWQTDTSKSESTSYSSDDFITFLEDGSGMRQGSDVMNIAVGRLPARNASEAKIWVDRLEKYLNSPQGGDWRNRIVLLADDGDDNIHASQTEEVWANMIENTDNGSRLTYQKIYLDAYEKNAGVTKAAREKFHNLLHDGVIWWNYVGHAAIANLTAEGMMTLQDLSNLYLRRPPFFYGATCSFGHWDGLEMSGLEQLLLTDAGGIIGGISAVRPVYIARNGVLSNAVANELFNSDDSGTVISVGEAMRRAKNRVADSNKLRYVFMGDPAMRLAIPKYDIRLDSVGSVATDPAPNAEQCVIQALKPVNLSGRVVTPQGDVASGFNGVLSLTIYDADRSVTSLGRQEATPISFDVMGERIYVGRAKVTDGAWSAQVIIPAEIADNFRPATLSMFASSEEGLEATGVSRDFYVYGIAEDKTIDDKAPSIEMLALNHPDFSSGDVVNASPMLLANVSDDTGLNMSTSGIGHQMTVRIDDRDTYSDVSLYFTPDENGNPSGKIAYQLPSLAAGNHTAMLKVWDIAGNSSSRSIDFFVDPTAAPKIFDVHTDANPATTAANFYVDHNRPDAMLEVRIDIFDMGGRLVWSKTSCGRADMYSSLPVTWDLTTNNGNKVNRGIYLYRATVSQADTPDAGSSAITKRIAVAP